jgi:cell wall-associated NlpC family hydrolase
MQLKFVSSSEGLARLKDAQGGQAVRLLEQSKTSASNSLPLAAAYNKAEPSTPAAEHTEFDHDLRICVDSALARVQTYHSKSIHTRAMNAALPSLLGRPYSSAVVPAVLFS